MENKDKQFWKEFIKMYHNLPCLWKIDCSDYTNRKKKIKAYDRLIAKLKEIYPDADREFARGKINALRTNYRRERKKAIESEMSGASGLDLYVPALWYYDLMTFLDDQIGKTKCKVDVEMTTAPPKPRKRKIDDDELLKMTMDKLNSNSKDKNCNDIVQYWNSQYKELDSAQQLMSRKIISDVLFHASLGKLDLSHAMQIQEILLQRAVNSAASLHSPEDDKQSNVSRASTPYSSMDVDIKECTISKLDDLNSSQDINQSVENLDSSSYSFEDPLTERANTRDRNLCETEDSSFEMMANIKLMMKLKWSTDDIMESLRKVYVDETPSRRQILEWIRDFEEDDDV